MPPELVEGLEETGPTFVRDEEEDYDLEWEEKTIDARGERRSPSILDYARRGFSQGSRANIANPAAPSPPGKTLKTGMRVRHAQFGDGIVLNRERVGNDIKLTITFSRVGKKTLIERYAKLESL